jgi:hypothetical protein
VALRPDSVAAGVCVRLGRQLCMGWQKRRGGWDGSLGGPQFGLGCSPFLCLPPSVAVAGQHDGCAQWKLDGEGDVVGGACEGSLEGR